MLYFTNKLIFKNEIKKHIIGENAVILGSKNSQNNT